MARLLQQPELIAAEVAQQHANADEQRARVREEMALIETALAKCDREEKRWPEAYAAEVINLEELKAYRADIEARRQSLQAHRGSLQAGLDAIGEAVARVEILVDYCARVRPRLEAFDNAQQRVAFEALDIHVSWIPGQP